MNEQHNNYENDDYTFLQEKIKDRPINKRKVFRQTIFTCALAVLFALVACCAFFFFEETLFSGFFTKEAPEPVKVTLQETTDEIKPEDMIQIETDSKDEPEPESSENSIATAAVTYEFEIEDYQTMYTKLRSLAQKTSRSLVTVTSVSDTFNWLQNDYENTSQTTGLILEDNGTELLIAVDYATIAKSTDILVTFFNTQEAYASVISTDIYNNLAILAVPLADLHDTTISGISYATLGNSSVNCNPGDVVVAVGDPLGYSSSVGYGIVTSSSTEINEVDHNLTLITTDIYGSANANGILLSSKGKVLGFINQSYNRKEYSNLISAVGISELRQRVEDMCNQHNAPHIGLYVTNVTSAAKQHYNIPNGAFILNIEMDSEAMKNGLHKGDVVTAINDAVISSVSDYEYELAKYQAGDILVISVMRPSGDTFIDMDIKVTVE